MTALDPTMVATTHKDILVEAVAAFMRCTTDQIVIAVEQSFYDDASNQYGFMAIHTNNFISILAELDSQEVLTNIRCNIIS